MHKLHRLVRFANLLDQKGMYDEADKLDDVLHGRQGEGSRNINKALISNAQGGVDLPGLKLTAETALKKVYEEANAIYDAALAKGVKSPTTWSLMHLVGRTKAALQKQAKDYDFKDAMTQLGQGYNAPYKFKIEEINAGDLNVLIGSIGAAINALANYISGLGNAPNADPKATKSRSPALKSTKEEVVANNNYALAILNEIITALKHDDPQCPNKNHHLPATTGLFPLNGVWTKEAKDFAGRLGVKTWNGWSDLFKKLEYVSAQKIEQHGGQEDSAEGPDMQAFIDKANAMEAAVAQARGVAPVAKIPYFRISPPYDKAPIAALVKKHGITWGVREDMMKQMDAIIQKARDSSEKVA